MVCKWRPCASSSLDLNILKTNHARAVTWLCDQIEKCLSSNHFVTILPSGLGYSILKDGGLGPPEEDFKKQAQ
jgi:hypothetical protein